MKLAEAFSQIYSSMLDQESMVKISFAHALVYNHTGLQYPIMRKSMAYLIKAPRDQSVYVGYQTVDIRNVFPCVRTDIDHQRLVIKHMVRENLIEVKNLPDFFNGECVIHFRLTKEMLDIMSSNTDYSYKDLTEMLDRLNALDPPSREFWGNLKQLTIGQVDENFIEFDEPDEDEFFEDEFVQVPDEDEFFQEPEDSIPADIELLVPEEECDITGEDVAVGPQTNADLIDSFPTEEDDDTDSSSGEAKLMVQLLKDVESEKALLTFERTLSKMKGNPMQKGWFSHKVQELSAGERTELAQYVRNFLRKGLTLDSKTVLEHRSLLEKGFLINMAILGDDSGKRATQYLLSPEGCRLLVKGFGMPDYGFITELADVVCYKDIKEKDLFYNFDTLEQVDIIRRATSQKDYDRVTKRMVERKRSPSLSFLLYGGPGTGKTELAKQVARENRRNLIVADYSKLQSQWIGEAPKRYRQIFIAYKYIAALSESAPILLFNEADSFLSQRITHITRGYEKEENAIQNLMLQEMENFEGIFIATTNCKQNLDTAFDRRFFSKVEVTAPDEANRRKIWKSIAPDYITEDVANDLARDYEFTGANIDNVINRLETISILYDKTPSHDDIIRECEAEKCIEEPRMKPRERVGFSY